MAPPKKPTHLRAVQGFPDHRPVNKKEPMPEAGFKPAPDYFSDEAKSWYNDLVRDLQRMGVMTVVDSRAAELLISAYAEYRELTELIERDGYTYWAKSATGDQLLKGNPAVNQRASAWNRVRGMLQEFGLTPAARSKVESNTPSDDDILTDLMRAKR